MVARMDFVPCVCLGMLQSTGLVRMQQMSFSGAFSEKTRRAERPDNISPRKEACSGLGGDLIAGQLLEPIRWTASSGGFLCEGGTVHGSPLRTREVRCGWMRRWPFGIVTNGCAAYRSVVWLDAPLAVVEFSRRGRSLPP